MKFKITIPFLILGLGVLIKIFLSVWYGYSNDELSALSRTVYGNLPDLVEKGVLETDMHPAGVQFFLTFWVKIFGTHEFFVRLPFVVASAFGFYGFYRFFSLFWSKESSTLFLIFVSFTFYPLLNTLFSRPYAIGVFFLGFVLFHIAKLIKMEKTNWKIFLFISFGWAGVFYTNYFATLFAGVLALLLIPLIPRKKMGDFLLSGLGGIILYLPHLPITWHHLDRGGLGWLPPPEPSFLAKFLFHVSNESIWFMGVIVSLTIAGLIRSLFLKEWKSLLFNLWAILVFISIFSIAYYYSIYQTPILKYQTLIFSFPFLVIFFADFISCPIKWLKKSYFGILSILFLATSIYSMRLFCSTCHFGVYRELGQNISKTVDKYGKSNTHFAISNLAPYYVNLYLERYNLSYNALPVLPFNGPIELDSILRNSEKPYFFFGYSQGQLQSEYYETIRDFYPKLIEAHQYFHSGTWLFKKANSKRVYKESYNIHTDNLMKDSSGYWAIPPKSYAGGFKIKVNAVDYSENDYFLYKVQANIPAGGELVLVHTGQVGDKIIEKDGVGYYFAKSNEQNSGQIDIRLVANIKTYMLGKKDGEEFNFYLWNGSDEMVYFKNVKLHLVDPSIVDQ